MKKVYKEDKCYYVWCPTKGAPTKAHEYISEAQLEAKRLARENPGHEYMVLKVVEGFKSPVQEMIYYSY